MEGGNSKINIELSYFFIPKESNRRWKKIKEIIEMEGFLFNHSIGNRVQVNLNICLEGGGVLLFI